ncbi:MAG: alpha-hydroxy acid oxidase [Pseudomonadota bacterium]
MPVITEIADLYDLYQKRVPKMFHDYCETGSWTEQTFRDNTNDFQDIRLRQKVAVDMSNRSTQSTMIGEEVAMPVALAPVGLTGMMRANGEIKAARAAEKFGVPYTLTTMSICSIEEVAEATTKPFWFQLYVMRDRGFVKSLLDRAKAAGCSALVLTLDLQLLGQRHKDLKNGLTAPPKPTLANILNVATKWTWLSEILRSDRTPFRNINGHAPGVTDASSLGEWTAEQFDLTLTWDDIDWIKDYWGGKLIIKGILDEEDAQRCVDYGADALIVSNHGGRQLDGALSSVRMLPSIVDAVSDKIEIHLDSGIRTGQDVLKALALGAKGCFIGRSYIYGLGAMGEEGVTKALEIIQKELDMTMALCGRRNVTDLNRDNLLIPEDFEGRWQ